MGWREQDAYDGDNEVVGWAKQSVPTTRVSFGVIRRVGTALRAFAHPTLLAVLAWLAVVAFCAWAGTRMWR